MTASRLFALRQVVCADAAAFEPALLDRDGAARAVKAWAAIANAAQAAGAMAAARVSECGTPAGHRDTADWLAQETGTTTAKARERIRTGDGLRAHERTRDAATSGRLSSDQAATITDAVAANPDAEQELLDTAARRSHAELKDACAKKKAAADPDPDATERRIHKNRCLRRYTDAEGAAHVHATGTKRDMARLDNALAREVDKIFQLKRAEVVRERFAAYQFDALISCVDKPGDGGTKPAIRHLGLLRIDWQALMRGFVTGDETCEIAGLGPIPVSTAREMLGESLLKLVITKGVDVVNVTHLGRGPTVAQKMALLWSQPRCTVDDCGRIHRLQVDHREDWARIHETCLHNLDRLCDHHHGLKTLYGWEVVNGEGPRPMVPPDHPDHPKNKNRPPP